MRWIAGLLILLCAAPLFAAQGHGDPIAPLALGLAIILMAAKLASHFMARWGLPAVLGELAVGVLLGNLDFLGVNFFLPMRADPYLDILARLGVIVLLFEVGLESTVPQMLKAGWTPLWVALAGVIAPFLLGWGVGLWVLPESSGYVHAFLGATLCATSVGITARVLQDMGKSKSPEARIILGASVIDDVLGLIVLAIVAGVIAQAGTGDSFPLVETGVIFGKAAFFLIGSLALGLLLAPKLFRLASRLRAQGVLLVTGLSFCFLLSYLADAIGLAAIVGAFAAGLILTPPDYRDFTHKGEYSLEVLIRPISNFLVPVFFVVMGLRTDLHDFLNPQSLFLGLVLTLAAVVGKQVCGLFAPKGLNRMAVGIGMIPRGEVGLIFANIGLGLSIAGKPLIDSATYSAIVMMVILTTLLTPAALKWSFEKPKKK